MMQKYQWDTSWLLLTRRNHWLWCSVTVGDVLRNGGRKWNEYWLENEDGASSFFFFALRVDRVKATFVATGTQTATSQLFWCTIPAQQI